MSVQTCIVYMCVYLSVCEYMLLTSFFYRLHLSQYVVGKILYIELLNDKNKMKVFAYRTQMSTHSLCNANKSTTKMEKKKTIKAILDKMTIYIAFQHAFFKFQTSFS